MSKRLLYLLCAALACAVLVAACGGDDDGGGAGTAPGTEETGVTEGAEVIDPASMEGATGEVKYCTGQDTTGERKDSLERFNEANPDLNATIVEFPASADEQRNQFIQRQEAQAPDCDVFVADVIWTAEFASQKWLYDLTPYIEGRQDEFIPSTLETTRFDNKFWGAPKDTNAGFLYYRTDQVDTLPETWQAVYEDAATKDGIAYQGASYEGLTVNFLELAFAAGGTALSEDGTEVTINSPENLEALQLMVDGLETGAAPRANVTYMEEESQRAFVSGRVTYLRNWPYVFAIGNAEGSEIRGDFEVAPFPSWEGGQAAGVLGGANLVISAFSENPGGALALVDFITNEESMNRAASEYALPPALSAPYDNPEVQEALPFAAELKQAVEQAKPRPVSPVYTQISQAIYENVNTALSGQATPEEALQNAERDMQQALETF
ncbi:MAG: ABC transporter substrate-binding protein [Solirubrobacteraceae bacterium]